MTCIGACNRDYDTMIESCPCMSNCPSGCPCPDYKCPCKPLYMSQCLLENGAKGMITFVEQDCQGDISVQIDASFTCTDIENCAADNHGFHVHMSAPSRQPDGTLDCGSAGGHFATDSQQHGRPTDANRFDYIFVLSCSTECFSHFGDLGNVLVSADVNTTVTIIDSMISLNPASESYIGNRGMVLHALPDDFTGASGNAGARVACCAIVDVSL